MVEADFECVAVQADFFVVLMGETGYVSVEDLEVADGDDVVADGENFGVVYGDFLYDAFDGADAHVVFDSEGSGCEEVESCDEVSEGFLGCEAYCGAAYGGDGYDDFG